MSDLPRAPWALRFVDGALPEYDRVEVECADRQLVVSVSAPSTQRKRRRTAEAIARLIAAGPELLEALENVPLPSSGNSPAEFYGRFYDWYEVARKTAIAKAHGAHP